MLTSVLLSLPVLLAGGALAVGLRSNRAAALVAIVTQALAAALVLGGVIPILAGGSSLELTWAWPLPIGAITFRVDALGAFFLSWSLPMTLIGTVYAVGYLRPYFSRGRHGGPHYALLNLVAASFVIIYATQNALVFLLGWEIAAVAAWLLVIWDYHNQKIRFAGFNYLVSTHVGLFVLVAAFMLLHNKTDSMDFAAFGTFLSRPGPAAGDHLPAARDLLRSEVSVLPVSHLAATGALGRPRPCLRADVGRDPQGRPVRLPPLHVAHGTARRVDGWTVLGFGALSAFFGVMYSCTERDLKRLLGYSSTENVGIAAVGFGVGYIGWSAGIPGLVVCRLRGRVASHLQPRALQVPAVLCGRRRLPRDSHRGHRAARRPGEANAANGDPLPGGRAGDLVAATAQRIRQ